MGENATGFGILDGVRDLVGVCADSPGDHDLATWMRLVTEVSDAMTVLAAARDEAIVRLAAIDEHVDEDGVVSEKVNGLGTVSLDAGSIVAVATNTTVNFAEELVHQAITRVIRVPVVHEAMATGTLDDYKARCIATELTDVPIDLARTVVDVLEEDMGAKTGPALRRRTQAILYRLSPDLLRERLQEARKDLGLQRWAGEPGTERWSGSFPSEDAARAWAAIDALARTLKKDGVCDTLKKARGKALMQIIDGRTDVKTILQLTVPAPAIEDAGSLPAAAGTTVPADGASSHRHGRDDTRSTAPPGPPSTGPAGPRSPDPVDTAPPARPGTPLSAGPRTPPRRSSGPSPEALSATAISRVPQQASRAVVASDESTSVEATSGEATEVFVAASGPIASELSWLPRSAVTPTTTTEAHSPNSGTGENSGTGGPELDRR